MGRVNAFVMFFYSLWDESFDISLVDDVCVVEAFQY